MAKLILATNEAVLDEYLRERFAGNIAAEVYYRAALVDVAKRVKADVAVVSAYLPGSEDMADVVLRVRAAGLRVVFLAGDLKRDDPLLAEIVACGVYDILFNEIRVEDIERRIEEPVSFAQALREVCVPGKLPARRLADLLRQGLDAGEGGGVEEAEVRRAPVLRRFLGRRFGTVSVRDGSARNGTDLSRVVLRPSRPVLAVWSPVSAGKTFVAVNLAYTLVRRGRKVVLADLDVARRGVHAGLCLPPEEDVLQRVMQSDLGKGFPGGTEVFPGLYVYSCGRDLPCEVNVRRLGCLLSSGPVGEVFVLDLPSVAPWLDALFAVSLVVLVGDPDYARAAVFRRSFADLRGRGVGTVTVVNRHATPEQARLWTPEEVFGAAPDAFVPCLPAEAYAASALGRPAVLCSAGLAEAFDRLARVVSERLAGARAVPG